jgi:glycosyltransferase involved in cell wall biosynthesis
MNILFLITHPDIRGPFPKILPVIASSLRGLGCEIDNLPWGQRSHREHIATKISRGLFDLSRIVRALWRKHYDFLLVNTAHDWRTLSRDIPLLLLARLVGQKNIVIVFHGSQAEKIVNGGNYIFLKLTSALVRLSTALFLLSKQELTYWNLIWPGKPLYVVRIPRVNLTVKSLIENTVFGPRGLVPIVLFVGRLIKQKGIYDLVEAFCSVILNIKCHLLIIGDGPELASLKLRIRELGIERSVTITGYLNGESLQKAYKAASILVLPTYSEGFPLVLLEAMVNSLPIITTRIRGAADWLKEKENALFIPAKEPEILANTIICLLNDKGLLKAMGMANKKLIERFEPKEVAAEWLGALTNISNVDSHDVEV